MKVSDFDFELPEELIAQRPPLERDAGRMLVVGEKLDDRRVRDFIDFLRPGDAVVFNNSKVIPCRFDAAAADGKNYEITLHTRTAGGWLAFAKKFDKLNAGDFLKLKNGTEIEVLGKNDESGLLIRFNCDNVFAALDEAGKIPLPPYIRRGGDDDDRDRYQTVYADPPGSMAAPTAGLHFTPEMLDAIEKAGAKIANITLHVGAGTWMPVKAADTENHKMHSEWGAITPEQAEIINGAGRVIAVGTTSLRLLESAAKLTRGDHPPRLAAFSGATDIFITPGYKFRAADVLLTNFHLPKSTLFMLVCAFAGTDEMKAAYAHAILEKYRFFSYGDCCMLFRKDQKWQS